MRVIVAIALLVLLLLSASAAADIVLIPSEPTAGKNLIFYLPSINMSAVGYVICENNDVHLVEIHNKLGQVTLDEDDYGTAIVKIFAGNKTYTKTFEITPFLAGSLAIEVPSSVLVNTETTIKIAAGAQPAEGALVSFSSLSGRSFNRVADENGQVTASFDEDGPWEINAEFYGATALATIKVMLPPIEITFSDKIEANEEMTISVGSTGDVTITKDEITWTYRTDANGDLYFTPPWPGKYNVYVKTAKQEGSKMFITTSETDIHVYDYEESVPVSEIKENQFVEIVVVDTFNVPVVDADEVLVYCDNSLWDSLSLSDGSVVWRVDVEALSYRFEFEAMVGYESSETTVHGLVEEGGIPFGDIAFYAVLIMIIVVLLVILVKKRRLLTMKLFGKKLTDVIHRGKKLE